MDGISLFDGVDVDVLGCVCVKLGEGGGGSRHCNFAAILIRLYVFVLLELCAGNLISARFDKNTRKRIRSRAGTKAAH